MPAKSGTEKLMITLYENDVAPRFDLTTEVMLARFKADRRLRDEQTVVLPRASAEELCHMILKEEVTVLICGGIEDEFYQYLRWKQIDIIDSVMGPWSLVLKRYREGRLVSGDVLYEKETEG